MSETRPTEAENDAITEAAAQWCMRLHEPDCTRQEREAFAVWLSANPLHAQEYEATSGGGMVNVKVSGKRELTAITINPQVVDPDDIDMLQDLIMAAVNEALRKGEEAREATMGKMAPGMGGMF